MLFTDVLAASAFSEVPIRFTGYTTTRDLCQERKFRSRAEFTRLHTNAQFGPSKEMLARVQKTFPEFWNHL